MFHLEIPFYSQFYKVIVIDYPGFGKSERLQAMRTDLWNYNAKAALRLLDILGIKSTKVIGTSGGALVGLNMAVIEPNRIEKLIADSFIGISITIADALKITKGRVKSKNQILASAFWKAQHGDDWEYVVDQDSQVFINVAYSALPTIFGKLENITADVLAIGSREDELIDNIEIRIRNVTDRIPKSKTMIFDEGKHPYMITKREEFRKIALDFFK
jgi:pimeloyl-ACP methyl ester carboxylesterase